MHRHLNIENTWMAHKHKKRCLTSTAIREMQNKATMRLKNDSNEENNNNDNTKY